jgi:hypothetical protein
MTRTVGLIVLVLGRFTLVVSAERSYGRDEIDRYEDGYAFERGGTEQFVSVELRYAFLPSRRVSPCLGPMSITPVPFVRKFQSISESPV